MKILYFSLTLIWILIYPKVALPQESKTSPANPLKEEMLLLDSAYKILIDSLLLNKLSSIERPVEEVLKAKEKTEVALQKGEIKLPKNNEKIQLFEKMDEQFHFKLKNLIVLSKKGDRKRLQTLTYELLDGCIGCHENFRE